MERVNHIATVLLIMLLLAAIALCCSCGKEKEEQPQQVILEPGLTEKEPVTPEPQAEPEPVAEEGDDFADKGRASTIDDLMANKEKIQSYYFEQTITTAFGDIFVKTWYTNGQMKIISTYEDGEENREYFDCEKLILVFHAPAVDDFGRMITFEPGDTEMPKNYLASDYHDFRVVDSDSIEGQTCRVLDTRHGEKLWVSTKHGFPLQREFTDTDSGGQYTVAFENIVFNQVKYEDVAIPEDLIIYQF